LTVNSFCCPKSTASVYEGGMRKGQKHGIEQTLLQERHQIAI
jgi:hypothetical protein